MEKPDYRLNVGSPMMSTNATNFTDPKLGTVIYDVGFEELASTSSLEVYPNPINNELNVKFSSTQIENTQLTIVNIDGKVVLSETVKANAGLNSKLINTSALSAGVYFVKVNNNTSKVVKF